MHFLLPTLPTALRRDLTALKGPLNHLLDPNTAQSIHRAFLRIKYICTQWERFNGP
jgi:hypothetical protein